MRRRYGISFCPLLLCLLIHLALPGVVMGRNGVSDSRQRVSSHHRVDGQYTVRANRDIIPRRGYEYYMTHGSAKTVPKVSARRSSQRKSTPIKKKIRKNKNKSYQKQKTTPKRIKGIYTVKRGDTLCGIARKTGVSLSQLKRLNKLGAGNKILVGMRLKLGSSPGKKSRVVKARNSSTSPCLRGLKFKWPLRKVRYCRRDGKKGVKPIGIIIKGAPGGVVRAAERGVVRRVGYMRGFGNYIVIEHANSYMTVYSHLGPVSVREGQKIACGGKIGGLTSEMLLHFQIDRKGRARNPLTLLPSRG